MSYLKQVQIEAIRIDCVTSVQRKVQVSCNIYRSDDGRLVFRLVGGPTGYEGFYIEDDNLEQMSKRGWCACMGTKGMWDKMDVPAKEMAKVLREVKKL